MYVMLTTPAIWAQFLSLLILMRVCAPDMAGVRWPAILFGIGWLCSGFFLALLLTRPLLTAPLWPSGPLPRSAVLAALSVGLSALALHGRPVGPFVAGLIAAVAAYGLTDHFELVLLADIALGALLALPARYRPSAMPAFWRNAIFVISALGPELCHRLDRPAHSPALGCHGRAGDHTFPALSHIVNRAQAFGLSSPNVIRAICRPVS